MRTRLNIFISGVLFVAIFLTVHDNHVLATSPSGNEQLLNAAFEGQKSEVSALLANGVNVNYCNFNGVTPLIGASTKGHGQVVELLLAKGADVNANAKNGATALFMAATNGHDAIVRILLANGADADARITNGDTVLIMAVAQGHHDIVRMLLTRGVDVNAKGDNGRTALMWASSQGHGDIVEMLLSSGADVNTRDDDGCTALDVARFMGQNAIVRILEKGSLQFSPPTMSAKDRETKKKVDIDVISDALEAYKKDRGSYPTDQQGLQVLLTARASGPDQGKPYIVVLPKTPWGRDYVYKTTEIRFIYREKTQPVGRGWKWHDGDQQWERIDNGYLIQVWEPDGQTNFMPKKQFGPLPSDVYFAPSGGFR